MTPIRARVLYTRYPHFGAHAGMRQFCAHLDPERVRASLHPVSDTDDDWPLPSNPLNTRLRRVVQRGMPWYKLSDLNAEIRAAAAASFKRVDVVHYLDAEHSAQYLPGWIGRRRGARARTVATFHQPPDLLPGLVSRRVLTSLDLVTVVSPTQEPFFRDLLPAERVRTILYGVDTDFFRPHAMTSGSDGARPFRCVTAGHWLRDWQAIRDVVATFEADRNIEFHLVTNRDTGVGDRPNVTVHQNVDDQSLRRIYQEADLLFLPLINATANNSLVEGMACGLPVLSTRLASVMAYVGTGAAELIDGNERDALIQAIVELRDDLPRRVAMGAAARARAEELAWPRVAPEFERAYADVMGR